MSQFKLMETSTIIIGQVLIENLLDKVYEVIVNVFIRLHSNSCGRNIYLYDYVWVIFLIQCEVLSKPFLFIYNFFYMVNIVLCIHKLLAILPLGSFFLIA